MNERIKELYEQSLIRETGKDHAGNPMLVIKQNPEKFAELIVKECRTVINDVYHKTPLELCGPLLTVDEEIMNHFYGVKE